MNKINIGMGEMGAGDKDYTFKTVGIGSCLVICLHDKANKIGGMAHAMLPTKRDTDGAKNDLEGRYVDESVRKLLSFVVSLGAKKENIVAKLVGGATMFSILRNSGEKSIGEKNIDSAKQELERLRIKVVNEDVGGSCGKVAEFNISNGVLNVNTQL